MDAASSIAVGDAVAVADEEQLRVLVTGHPSLCWSTACEKLLGSQGIVSAVDDADNTVKLEPLVENRQGDHVRIDVTQWLPWDAVTPASSNLDALRAALETAWMPRDQPAKVKMEEDPVRKAADLDWSARSGREFPFDLVITSMTGREVHVPVTSLATRLEDIHQIVARTFGKAKSQIRLSINQEMLPQLGTLQRISEDLASTTCLQVIIVKRQLSGPVVKRLRKEERDREAEACWNFELVSVPDPDVEPISDTLEAIFAGPADSPYEGGTFRLSIKIPSDYPFRPPRVTFLTKIWIPSVHPSSGGIDLDILRDHWSPALSIAKVVRSIISMMEDPSDDACENQEALQQIREVGKEKFRNQAQKWTQMYAV